MASEWETVDYGEGQGWKGAEVGDSVEGEYLRAREIEDTDQDGNGYSFKVYDFKTEEGEIRAVKSSYKIDQIMAKATPGEYVKITYLGDIEMGPGRNAMRNYSLQRRKAATA